MTIVKSDEPNWVDEMLAERGKGEGKGGSAQQSSEKPKVYSDSRETLVAAMVETFGEPAEPSGHSGGPASSQPVEGLASSSGHPASSANSEAESTSEFFYVLKEIY